VLLTHFVQCREFRTAKGRQAGVAVFAGASLPSEADTIYIEAEGRHSRAQRRQLPLSSAAFWQVAYARNSCFLTTNAFLITVRQLLIRPTDYIEIFRRADSTAKNDLPRGQE
jgi:hypothetical protein